MTQTVPDISPLMPMHQDPLLVTDIDHNPISNDTRQWFQVVGRLHKISSLQNKLHKLATDKPEKQESTRYTEHKYSLLMHRIKIKSPANVFMERIKRFCGWIYHYSISITLMVLQWQKKAYWRYHHSRYCRPPWSICHWSVSPRAQLTITQYWFRQWLGAE